MYINIEKLQKELYKIETEEYMIRPSVQDEELIIDFLNENDEFFVSYNVKKQIYEEIKIRDIKKTKIETIISKINVSIPKILEIIKENEKDYEDIIFSTFKNEKIEKENDNFIIYFLNGKIIIKNKEIFVSLEETNEENFGLFIKKTKEIKQNLENILKIKAL